MATTSQHDPSKRLKRLGLGLHGLGLSIVLATAGLGYALVMRPLDRGIEEWDDRSFQLQACLQDAPKVRAEHQRLRGAMAAAEAKTADLQKRVPDEPSEAEFLGQLAQAAKQTNLQISDYRPGVVRGGRRCSQLQIQLSCKGTYRSICNFLDCVAALPRITQVEKLDITAAGPDGHPVTLWLVVYFRLTKTPAEPGGREEGEKGRRGERGNASAASPLLPLSSSPLLPFSEGGPVHG
jgi:Tfp pilus assembly protein PilO